MDNKRILKYVKSCVHLYGVVSIQQIINTIKLYESDIPTRKEVLKVVESYITPHTSIQLQLNLVYNKKIVDEEEDVRTFHQHNEPDDFFTPDYLQLLFNYESPFYYEKTCGYGYLYELLLQACKNYVDLGEKVDTIIEWVISIARQGFEPKYIIATICKDDAFMGYFDDKEHTDKLLEILTTICQNARLYHENGFTLLELRNL